jgi:isocitrate dehydrogenase
MSRSQIRVPEGGARIGIHADGSLRVPDNPVIPFIEGDGIGIDISPVMRAVVDAAVACTYPGQRQLHWMEVYCGGKAAELYDGDWYPAETLDLIKEHAVVIKGPITMPVGDGFRSLAIALRQEFDLYAVVRPVRGLAGFATPCRNAGRVDAIVFRENNEDTYAGIEWQAGSPQAEKLIRFLREELGVKKILYPDECSIGIKPVSAESCRRLVRRAIGYAIDQDLPSVTLAHKGDVLKYTEGAFRRWGFQLATDEFGARPRPDQASLALTSPLTGREIVIKEIFADGLLQRMLTHPDEFSVIATLNMNGDYIADALTAQVGAVGIAPSANIGDGVAVFECTHGTAPRRAGSNRADPTSLILAAEMLLRHIGWREAADRLGEALQEAMRECLATMPAATDGSTPHLDVAAFGCREFGDVIIRQLTRRHA